MDNIIPDPDDSLFLYTYRGPSGFTVAAWPWPPLTLTETVSPASAEPVSERVQAAARTLGMKLHVLHASSEPELEAVLATAARRTLEIGHKNRREILG